MPGINDDLDRLQQQSALFKKLAASKQISGKGKPIAKGTTMGGYTVHDVDPTNSNYKWIKKDSSQVTPADSTDFVNNFTNKLTGRHDLMSYEKDPPPPPKLLDSVFHAWKPPEIKDVPTGRLKVPGGKLVCTADKGCVMQGNTPHVHDMAVRNMDDQEKNLFGTNIKSTQAQFVEHPTKGMQLSSKGHESMQYIPQNPNYRYGGTQGNYGAIDISRPKGVENPYSTNASTADFALRGQIEELVNSGKMTPEQVADAFAKTNPQFNKEEYLKGFTPEMAKDTTEPEINRTFSKQQMDFLRAKGDAGKFGTIKGYASQQEAEADTRNKKLQELLQKRRGGK